MSASEWRTSPERKSRKRGAAPATFAASVGSCAPMARRIASNSSSSVVRSPTATLNTWCGAGSAAASAARRFACTALAT